MEPPAKPDKARYAATERGTKTMSDLPDMLTGGGGYSGRGPDGKVHCGALVTVEATSERGQAFLSAYYGAIGQQAGGLFEDDEPLFLSFPPEKFGQLKRQASLACLSIGELRDYPDYESYA